MSYQLNKRIACIAGSIFKVLFDMTSRKVENLNKIIGPVQLSHLNAVWSMSREYAAQEGVSDVSKVIGLIQTRQQ